MPNRAETENIFIMTDLNPVVGAAAADLFAETMADQNTDDDTRAALAAELDRYYAHVIDADVHEDVELTVLTTSAEPETHRGYGKGSALLFGAALLLTACAGKEVETTTNTTNTTGVETTTTVAETPTTKELTTCENYGEVVHVSAGETHRLIGDGVPSIGTAKTPEEAREAAGDYYNLISADPELLAGGYNVLVATDDETKLLGADLIGEDGCFNDRGATVAAEVYTTLYTAKIVPDQAPADGVNSGTNDAGDVVFAEAPGISGNRKAILVTTDDGRKVWVMERCGNYVMQTPVPGVPKGPTDEPTPTPDKTPRPLEGVMPHPQPGAGGEQGSPAEPDCDSDNDGYCDGQPRPTVPDDEPESTVPDDETTPTTGKPREEAPSTPATTVVKPPNDTKPPHKPDN